jgi:calcineurin-like phosphoesterase family protein
MKTWIISDTHFNHSNIILYENRPFADKDEMNEELIKRWNEIVAPEDTVYHLGDVVFGGKAVREGILNRLNGYKILRVGNHDNRATITKWKEVFDEVYEDDILLDDLCLSHYPLNDYEMERLLALGIIKGNVHGHVHSVIDGLDQTKYKCVSVELTDYRPIDFEVVKAHFGVK